MSGTINIKNKNTGESIYSGVLVLTEYGQQRLLEKMSLGEGFTQYNLKYIVIGDKINTTYDPSINTMGNELMSFTLDEENISTEKNIFMIRATLDVSLSIIMQELGLFEELDGKKYLFAYASGFSLIKDSETSYDLEIQLGMNMTFENEHYKNYEVTLVDTAYAPVEIVPDLHKTLTNVQLDLERVIETNARILGYNTAQVYYKKQTEIANAMNNMLMFSRLSKIANRIDTSHMTDYFCFPEDNSINYSVQNLQDNSSYINVTGDIYKANKDNNDLSKPFSLVVTTTLDTLNNDGVIVAKSNPNSDEYYWELRIKNVPVENMENYITVDEDGNEITESKLVTSKAGAIQFTIYSYSEENADLSYRKKLDEKNIIGHLRATYIPQDDLGSWIEGQVMITVLYNGDIKNPQIRLFRDSIEVNPVIDEFNYMGPYQNSMERCTIRNYDQTVETIDYNTPMIYSLPNIKTTSIMCFDEEISEEVIKYLSII